MTAPDHATTMAGLAATDAVDATPATLSPPQERSGPPSSFGEDHSDIEKVPEPATEEPSPRDVHGIRWGLAVFSVLISTFLFALDNTIVADIQPAIVESFGEVSKLSWLSVAFLVAAIGTNLFWGKMYSQFDAKYLYLFTVFLFEAGSAICGAANSMDLLIFGRALCGLGGVGLYAGVMTLLSVTTTEHERPMYIGLTGLTWGLGTVLGPIIGGAFTSSNAGWRWGFYINLCVGGVLVPAWVFFLPRYDPRPGVPLKHRFTEIDFLGTILICGAMVTGVMAIDFGGTTYPWRSGRIIGLFCASGILFIIFGLQQTFTVLTSVARRLFPVEFLGSRTMILLFVATACGSTSIFVPIYFIPLFFQFVLNSSAISAGVHLLPFVVVLVIFCVANGAIMGATGYYMPWFFGGGVFTIIGSSLLYTITETSSQARVYGYTVILAVGGGSFVQAGFSVAQAKVGKVKIPEAIGFITLGQLLGATIALAIANSVFLNDAAKGIEAIIPTAPTSQIYDAISGAGSTFIRDLPSETQTQVLHALVEGMRKVYILPLTAGALVLVASLGMKREKMFMKAGAMG